MKKRILLFPLLFLMITIFSCKDKTKEQSKLEYSKYISGFTQGMIKSSDPFCRLGTVFPRRSKNY